MEIPPSAVTIYPKGTPVPTPTVEVQVLETRVDLSNDMTWRQMFVLLKISLSLKWEMVGVGVRIWTLRRRARSIDKLLGLGSTFMSGDIVTPSQK